VKSEEEEEVAKTKRRKKKRDLHVSCVVPGHIIQHQRLIPSALLCPSC